MLNVNQFPSDEAGWVKPRLVDTPPTAPPVVGAVWGVEVKQKRKRRTKAQLEAQLDAEVESTVEAPPPVEPPRKMLTLADKDDAPTWVDPSPRVAGIVGQAGTLCYIGEQVYLVIHKDEELLLLRKVP